MGCFKAANGTRTATLIFSGKYSQSPIYQRFPKSPIYNRKKRILLYWYNLRNFGKIPAFCGGCAFKCAVISGGFKMKKIAGLYRNYVAERDEIIKEYQTGGNLMEELQNFLKQKLNAEDYYTAEEMLNNLAAAIEEKGFDAGCKYIADLGNELFTNK